MQFSSINFSGCRGQQSPSPWITSPIERHCISDMFGSDSSHISPRRHLSQMIELVAFNVERA